MTQPAAVSPRSLNNFTNTLRTYCAAIARFETQGSDTPVALHCSNTPASMSGQQRRGTPYLVWLRRAEIIPVLAVTIFWVIKCSERPKGLRKESTRSDRHVHAVHQLLR